jgi:quercetin dioxygenase-like cupin family protein
MPSITLAALPVREIFPGIRARLVHTDRVTHSWVEIDEGTSFPEHHHPHEQIVSVLDGTLALTVDGVRHDLTPGTVFVIPPEARHSGQALTRCRVLDTFAPARDDYR